MDGGFMRWDVHIQSDVDLSKFSCSASSVLIMSYPRRTFNPQIAAQPHASMSPQRLHGHGETLAPHVKRLIGCGVLYAMEERLRRLHIVRWQGETNCEIQFHTKALLSTIERSTHD
jgi:hypothetical protein